MSSGSSPYSPVSVERYRALEHAFREAPQGNGRFTGTHTQQVQLAQQMRELFDGPAIPPGDVLYFDRDEVVGLADSLEGTVPDWSIGQFSSALASLQQQPVHRDGHSFGVRRQGAMPQLRKGLAGGQPDGVAGPSDVRAVNSKFKEQEQMSTPNQSYLMKLMQWRLATAIGAILWDLGVNARQRVNSWRQQQPNDVVWWPSAWRVTDEVFHFRPNWGAGGGDAAVTFLNPRFDPTRGQIWYGDKKVAENVLVADDANTKLIRNDSDSTIHVAYQEEVGLVNSYSAGITKGVTLDVAKELSSETTAEVKVSGEYAGVSAEASLSETFGISKSESREESKEEAEERSREGSRTESIAIEFDAEPGKHYLVTISKEHITSYQPFSIKGVMDFDLHFQMPRHSGKGQQHSDHHPGNRVALQGFDGLDQWVEGYDTNYPSMQGFLEQSYSDTKKAFAWLMDPQNRYIEVSGTKESSEEGNATYQVESLGGTVPDALAHLQVVTADDVAA